MGFRAEILYYQRYLGPKTLLFGSLDLRGMGAFSTPTEETRHVENVPKSCICESGSAGRTGKK